MSNKMTYKLGNSAFINCHGNKTLVIDMDSATASGTVVDRLYEYESTGLEPEEIKTLMEVHADLLAKNTLKKVIVEKEFKHSNIDLPEKMYGCYSYPAVEEKRYYRCPSCKSILADRYKITKLYPNRTIGTDGNYGVAFKHASRCKECTQLLDWNNVEDIWA